MAGTAGPPRWLGPSLGRSGASWTSALLGLAPARYRRFVEELVSTRRATGFSPKRYPAPPVGMSRNPFAGMPPFCRSALRAAGAARLAERRSRTTTNRGGRRSPVSGYSETRTST